MSGKSIFAGILLLGLAGPVAADQVVLVPSCALSGATSVMIGGQPALRMADVINCPPELYEIVPSIFIEGQPIVHFRSGSGAKADCSAKSDGTVMTEGEATPRLGDVACKGK